MTSEAPAVNVQVAEKLVRLVTTPKRIKVAVGGRGGSKSIAFGDCFLKFCADGEQLCCLREFQNSIDDSVHGLLKSRIEALGATGFYAAAGAIQHDSGGSIIYKGLARNVQAIRSLFGIKRAWVEEAQTLSDESVEVLLPTIREPASELWFSMNRGSSKDPIAVRLLKPYERELKKHGWYEDDDILIVQINYDDNPFFPAVLEQERQRDLKKLPRAKYDHIWKGAYGDTVPNAIILPEWFDACVDAHEKLGFEALGAEVVAHDPAENSDSKALAHRHGSVIVEAKESGAGDVNEGCDWATGYAHDVKADEFIWDADGMGLSLKRQISEAFDGTRTEFTPFHGAAGVSDPDADYEPVSGEDKAKAKTNKQAFVNRRAQRYWQLRDRVYRTYLAVKHGEKFRAADELISFSSKISCLEQLRAELCRIPRKENGTGRIQIMTKPEMKSKNIDSPNLADSVMMTMEGGRLRPNEQEPESYDVPDAHSAFRSR